MSNQKKKVQIVKVRNHFQTLKSQPKNISQNQPVNRNKTTGNKEKLQQIESQNKNLKNPISKNHIFHNKEARIQRNKHYVAIFHATDRSNVPTK